MGSGFQRLNLLTASGQRQIQRTLHLIGINLRKTRQPREIQKGMGGIRRQWVWAGHTLFFGRSRKG